jgi:hypothetical protein
METIAYAQVQELVMRLPAKKLQVAYSFLVELANQETDAPLSQVQFMLLPLAERQRLTAQ